MGAGKTSWRLWQPPAETLETIAAALRHWRGAAARATQLWASPVSWVAEGQLRDHAQRALAHHHFTTGGKLIK